MRAALGLILLALLASGICGHIVTKQQVNAIVDDAAPEARLYFGSIKNKTKDVYSAIKTKLGFDDDDEEDDDVDAHEARLYFGSIKTKTKNVYSDIKTKLGFDDDDEEDDDVDAPEARLYFGSIKNKTKDDDTPEALFKAIKTKLGLPRFDKEYCRNQALAAIWDCLGEPGVVDDDSLMTCMVGYITDDCHDEVCENFATYTFLSCP